VRMGSSEGERVSQRWVGGLGKGVWETGLLVRWMSACAGWWGTGGKVSKSAMGFLVSL
jgi:hypothetical protein